MLATQKKKANLISVTCEKKKLFFKMRTKKGKKLLSYARCIARVG